MRKHAEEELSLAHENGYMLYTLSYCPFCVAAKEFLLESKLNHTIIPMDGKEDLLDEIKKMWQWETVPIVLEKKESTLRLIGGYDDLKDELNHD